MTGGVLQVCTSSHQYSIRFQESRLLCAQPGVPAAASLSRNEEVQLAWTCLRPGNSPFRDSLANFEVLHVWSFAQRGAGKLFSAREASRNCLPFCPEKELLVWRSCESWLQSSLKISEAKQTRGNETSPLYSSSSKNTNFPPTFNIQSETREKKQFSYRFLISYRKLRRSRVYYSTNFSEKGKHQHPPV